MFTVILPKLVPNIKFPANCFFQNEIFHALYLSSELKCLSILAQLRGLHYKETSQDSKV